MVNPIVQWSPSYKANHGVTGHTYSKDGRLIGIEYNLHFLRPELLEVDFGEGF